MRAPWEAVLGLALAAGCGGSPKLLGHPVHQPINIVVRVSEEVEENDDGGAIASMVDAMLDGLHRRGLEGQVYAHPDEHPPPPMQPRPQVNHSATRSCARSSEKPRRRATRCEPSPSAQPHCTVRRLWARFRYGRGNLRLSAEHLHHEEDDHGATDTAAEK